MRYMDYLIISRVKQPIVMQVIEVETGYKARQKRNQQAKCSVSNKERDNLKFTDVHYLKHVNQKRQIEMTQIGFSTFRGISRHPCISQRVYSCLFSKATKKGCHWLYKKLRFEFKPFRSILNEKQKISFRDSNAIFKSLMRF